jgi:CubicO group peptidase (beta-lactamase class C family)
MNKQGKLKNKNMKKHLYVTVLVAVFIFGGCNKMIKDIDSASDWPWEQVSPESQGIDSKKLDDMLEYIDDNKVDVHSVIIYKNGSIPYEKYFAPFSKNDLHNLKSTSKGVISALTGIALHEGYIESLDESILSYLTGYDVDTTGKTDITIRHLLTMSAGLKWDENNFNSMYTFFVNKRIVKRVLDQPLESEPGTEFNYNTGLTHLLSAIISEASGMSTQEFAEKYLFGALNIENIHWETDREGYHIGGSELFLTARAMTKFGVLYLQEGKYAGNQVVPEDWVTESKNTQFEGNFHGSEIQYGYLWWLNIDHSLFTYADDEQRYLAMGARGQRILICPEYDAVIVVTADEKNESECDKLIRDFIVPALENKQ